MVHRFSMAEGRRRMLKAFQDIMDIFSCGFLKHRKRTADVSGFAPENRAGRKKIPFSSE
jgi:hypothetical protein